MVAAADGTLADNADFGPTVKAAHQSLKRQPGVDLSQDEALRAITQATQTMATSLAPLRNHYGTGHGRARVPDVTVEMATVTAEAALVWCRWALGRLGHFLADYPNDLIDAVQTGTTRELLATIPGSCASQQPVEVQHRIGFAFGQQSAGGFGNATEVGVEPAMNGGFDEFPIDYRRGLIDRDVAHRWRLHRPDDVLRVLVRLAARLAAEGGCAGISGALGCGCGWAAVGREVAWVDQCRSGRGDRDPARGGRTPSCRHLVMANLGFRSHT